MPRFTARGMIMAGVFLIGSLIVVRLATRFIPQIEQATGLPAL